PALANIEGTALAYTAGEAATAITQSLTATDIDSATLVGATASFSNNFVPAEDALAFANTPNITGSVNSATRVVQLTGTDTVDNYQAALRSVTYIDTNLLPTASLRTVAFQVDDGFAFAHASNTVTRDINVQRHIAPVLANIEGSPLA